MSVLNKDFQKCEEIVTQKQLEKIIYGINRIRYIQNKIVDEGNLIISLLSGREQRGGIKQQNKSFMTTNFKSLMDRKSKYQIRQGRVVKSRQSRQEENLQRVRQIKNEKRQIKSVLAKRNEEILMEKIYKKKKLLKEKEIGKIKVNKLMENRLRLIKQSKQKMYIERQKYLVGEKRNQKYFQDYETKLILTQKLKQFILKYRTQQQPPLQNTKNHL